MLLKIDSTNWALRSSASSDELLTPKKPSPAQTRGRKEVHLQVDPRPLRLGIKPIYNRIEDKSMPQNLLFSARSQTSEVSP